MNFMMLFCAPTSRLRLLSIYRIAARTSRLVPSSLTGNANAAALGKRIFLTPISSSRKRILDGLRRVEATRSRRRCLRERGDHHVHQFGLLTGWHAMKYCTGRTQA